MIRQAPVAPPSSFRWASVSMPLIILGIKLTNTERTIAMAHAVFIKVGRLRRIRNLYRYNEDEINEASEKTPKDTTCLNIYQNYYN